ncbi:MAG TPA: hypothetical protein VEV16_13430, partial [Daejeonella sp.]|nr:hypothetical protein [Daejeonella sp.]
MKKSLLIAFMAIISVCAQAQTKGTNTIGFGFSHANYSQKYEENSYGNQHQVSTLNFGYGRFINENEKAGFTFLYGKNKYGINPNETTSNQYGGDLSYQKYYPLFKKFYAYAGGRLGYSKEA